MLQMKFSSLSNKYSRTVVFIFVQTHEHFPDTFRRFVIAKSFKNNTKVLFPFTELTFCNNSTKEITVTISWDVEVAPNNTCSYFLSLPWIKERIKISEFKIIIDDTVKISNFINSSLLCDKMENTYNWEFMKINRYDQFQYVTISSSCGILLALDHEIQDTGKWTVLYCRLPIWILKSLRWWPK